MRVTIDIPDAQHRRLKTRVAAEGTTMRALILRGIGLVLAEGKDNGRRRLKFPLVTSKWPGSMKLGKKGV